jgi:hypothetical protein
VLLVIVLIYHIKQKIVNYYIGSCLYNGRGVINETNDFYNLTIYDIGNIDKAIENTTLGDLNLTGLHIQRCCNSC